ncbi:MAG: hypothetical protein ABI432_02405 [Flavobacteriales bacterium]
MLLIRVLGPCSAQDVFLSPAFEHVAYDGDGYVDGNGASLGLRFPIAHTRSTIELRPTYTKGKHVIESLSYEREDRRVGGAFEILRSTTLNEGFALDLGAEAGYYMRRISVNDDGGATIDQPLATIGCSLTIRASRSNSVQLFLSVHPFYERSLGVQYDHDRIPVNMESQVGLSLSFGFILGLPSPANGAGWD